MKAPLVAALVALGLSQSPLSAGPSRPVVSVGVRRATASEPGKNAAQWGGITVRRTGDLTKDLVVNAFLAGFAVYDQDYRTSPPMPTTAILIPAGEEQVTLVIKPIDDTKAEGEEYLTLSVMPGTGYDVGAPGAGMVKIKDND